jgi:DNA-directed RNA polymerase specialized sigma24 family protein
MARIDWIEQQLQNWARWKLCSGSGVLGFASVDLADADAGRDGYITATIPTVDCEASEMNDAIERLPSELKATVLEVYLGRGGMKDKARRLCCAPATIDQRIYRAHRMLADHFLAKQDRQRAERARVEALQRGVRPA